MDGNASRPVVSPLAFAVGFYLSFRIIITVFCVRILSAAPQTGSAIGVALGFCLLGSACLAWLDAPSRPSVGLLRPAGMRWALVFIAFSGCSLLWSETASPFASSVYWCTTVADMVMVALLLLAGPIPDKASALMKGFVWGSCLVAAIAWVMPTQYDLRLGDEDFLNANTIGNVCAFAVFFAQYLLYRRQGKWWPAAAFLAITLIRTLSKSAIAAFVISECFLLIQDKQMSRRTKVFLTAAAIVLVIAFWGLFEAYYDFYTTYGNEAETLTGRTAIWAYVLDEGLQRPWIGHGFDSMWNVIPAFGTFEARHAENELLEQFYSYGFAGVVILCGVYGGLYYDVRRLRQRALEAIVPGIILFVLVRGIAEADPFDLLLPLWAVVLFSGLSESAREEEAAAASDSERSVLPQFLSNDNVMTPF